MGKSAGSMRREIRDDGHDAITHIFHETADGGRPWSAAAPQAPRDRNPCTASPSSSAANSVSAVTIRDIDDIRNGPQDMEKYPLVSH
jgi:hypothetical protein